MPPSSFASGKKGRGHFHYKLIHLGMKNFNKWLRYLAYSIGALLLLLLMTIALLAEKDKSIETLADKYKIPHSSFIPLMGMQVHYAVEGNEKDSLPLLLIHGTSSSLHTWDSLVSLCKQEKKLIRMDLPAFGLTGPNPANQYGADYYVKFIDSFMLALQLNKAIVVGNSLGGRIAWGFALAHPEKTAKLVLIDASGYPRKNEKGSLGFKLAQTPVLNNLLLYVSPKALVRKSLEDAYYNKQLVSDVLADRYHDMLLREGNRAAALSIFKSGYKDNGNQIKNIHCPTLIIWGKQDQLIAVENASKFKADIKGSELEILDETGHVPMEERPLEVSRLILNFIGRTIY